MHMPLLSTTEPQSVTPRHILRRPLTIIHILLSFSKTNLFLMGDHYTTLSNKYHGETDRHVRSFTRRTGAS